MKVKKLVTDKLGCIGSCIVIESINEGFGVIIVDDLSNFEIKVLNRIKRIIGIKSVFRKFYLLTKKILKVLFKRPEDIEEAFRFAAYKSVGESVEQPIKYYDNNVNSTLNIAKEKPCWKETKNLGEMN